jgi:hypothetical protein
VEIKRRPADAAARKRTNDDRSHERSIEAEKPIDEPVVTKQVHVNEELVVHKKRKELQRRYFLKEPRFEPRVYWRMTDNWLELTVRFIAQDHGVRELKDAITRDILAAFDQAGIGIASASFEVVGVPPLKLSRSGDRS